MVRRVGAVAGGAPAPTVAAVLAVEFFASVRDDYRADRREAFLALLRGFEGQ